MWRERVGIEPTSRLATASTILKTVRATRPVRSHDAMASTKRPFGDRDYRCIRNHRGPPWSDRAFRRNEAAFRICAATTSLEACTVKYRGRRPMSNGGLHGACIFRDFSTCALDQVLDRRRSKASVLR
jgi:hypothetical protein